MGGPMCPPILKQFEVSAFALTSNISYQAILLLYNLCNECLHLGLVCLNALQQLELCL